MHRRETCGVGLPIASQTGSDPAVLLGRNAHGDIGYLHDSTGAVSTTSVFDPFGQLVGNDATGSMLGFQGDYTDATTGDVWMGARWYRPGTGGFVSRDTVFGQLQTPMSVNRYTYALGDPLGRWDPDGRCSKQIWVHDASLAEPETCTDDLMDVVSAMEQRSANLSQRFMAGMLEGLRTVAENPIVSLIAPGVDCAIIALNKAQGQKSGAMDYAGCAMDAVPGVGKLLSKTVGAGTDLLSAGRRASNVADRAGDAGRRVDEVPALTRVEAPSVSRVAPEPRVVKAPEAKSFDPPDPATRRAGPDPDVDANSGPRKGNPSCKDNSFTAETGVLMADGSVVAIADVELGDWVLAADPETGEFGARQVTRLIFGSGVKTLVEITIDGATVTATDEHPIWVDSDGAWVDAEDVRAGDVLLTPDGVSVVDAVTVETVASAEVFNLTVDGIHTFYVLVGDEPILTHNQDDACELNRRGDVEDVELVLNFKPGWSATQKSAAQSKVGALNDAGESGLLAKASPNRTGGSARSRYKADGGVVAGGQDVDHVIELQLGGADDLSNMLPLDRSVNRSIGAQIACALRDMPMGTRVVAVSIC